MAIEMRIEDGLLCPRVVCDVCAKPIAERARGNVLWERGSEAGLHFTHKRCYQAFKAAYGAHYQWQDLTAFMFYLANNTGFEAIDGRKAAGVMSLAVLPAVAN
jgi:hypothetical protein